LALSGLALSGLIETEVGMKGLSEILKIASDYLWSEDVETRQGFRTVIHERIVRKHPDFRDVNCYGVGYVCIRASLVFDGNSWLARLDINSLDDSGINCYRILPDETKARRIFELIKTWIEEVRFDVLDEEMLSGIARRLQLTYIPY